MYKFKHLPNLIKYLHHNIHRISAYPGYEILEYCESSGNQYINTGVSFNNSIIIDGNFQQLNSDGFQGYASSNSRATFYWTTYNFCANNWKYYTLGEFDTEKHHIYLSNGLQKRDEATYNISIANSVYSSNYSTNTYIIYLYAGSTEWDRDRPQWFMQQRIYDLKIYKNGQLIRDFIPAREKATNRVGLYDRLNKNFYGSANGNNFIAGPRVVYGV